MPLNVPVLDDRTYADLVEEGLQIIPRHAPEWTNHNASDPGVTLIELYAYLADICLYRIDRSLESSKSRYLELLAGSSAGDGSEAVDLQIRKAVAEMRRPYRAVSAGDFERLTREAAGESAAAVSARCFGRVNLEAPGDDERRRDRPGHVSVVFAPGDPWSSEDVLRSTRERIVNYLEPRRLLTTRVHVVAATFVDVAIEVQVVAAGTEMREALEDAIRATVIGFLDPVRGGPDGTGYPLGRNLFVFDLHRRFHAVQGVSGVQAVVIGGPERRLLRASESAEVIGVQLKEWELPRIREELVRVTTAAEHPGRPGGGS